MATELILPRVDMDMSEGKIAHWYVKNGDSVTKGQVVFEIETDKATMEIDAPADGIVQGIDGEVGVTMPVGQIVGWILQSGEVLPTAKAAAADETAKEVSVEAVAADAPAEKPVVSGAAPNVTQLRATPLARSLAREHGIDLNGVEGSGPDGRVVAGDLKLAESKPALSAKAAVSGQASLNLHWFGGSPASKTAPLVLLHGFGTSLGSWRPLSQELKDLPLVGIDLPNHGKSPRMATPHLASVAAAVLKRLDGEGIDALHLVGHSMGGGTALALSALLGARLKSLTLIAPAAMGPEINGAFVQGLVRASREESLRPWLAQLFGDATRLSGSFVATAWKELESADHRAGLADMADRLLPDGTQAEILRGNLDKLTVPVKVIWGTLDRVVPFHQSANLQGTVALHSLAGIGHLPQVEAVALVARLVRQQIASGEALTGKSP
ncbi:MAG: acetoin dehydrogenase dihydrolipoyllysine-residue acetyltransferase subunit [Comamonadaceae bacterium]|nr:MAG: acetoin dehydrogenase dihydrolipoyllysine-residue acetyltransferase subunit [Comamonadaceae bacterium]